MGGWHILALDRQNRVHGWGNNDYGRCGVDSSADWINTPTRLPQMNNCQILQTVAGAYHSFIKY